MDNEQSPYITEDVNYKFGIAAVVFIIIMIIIMIYFTSVSTFVGRSLEIPISYLRSSM